MIEPSTASRSAYPVNSMRTVRGDIARTFDNTSTPVIFGMRWSATMTSMSLSRDDVECFGAVRREEQLELPAEHDPHRVQHALLVVDEQQPRAVVASCTAWSLHALDRFL